MLRSTDNTNECYLVLITGIRSIHPWLNWFRFLPKLIDTFAYVLHLRADSYMKLYLRDASLEGSKWEGINVECLVFAKQYHDMPQVRNYRNPPFKDIIRFHRVKVRTLVHKAAHAQQLGQLFLLL